MAEKAKINTNLFAKTDPKSNPDQVATGPTITKGVGLKESEWQELQDIGAELGQTQHAMTAYAVRYFLKQYRTGAIQTESKPSLPDL